MLFDLQSRGRRGAVKVIYLMLAVILGGGLVLFGVGTGTGGGGLLDVFKGGNANPTAQISSLEKRASGEVRQNPQNPQAWADLARARYQTAGQGENYDPTQGTFTEAGKTKLGTAASAWKRYLALNPPHPDATLARLMATAYSEAGLNDPAGASSALEIVTQAQPSASSFGLLAQYAYLAGQLRKGDLAAAKAVQLAPKVRQKLVKTQLATSKKQAIQQQIQDAAQKATSTPSGG
jgi:hypothetical protein